MNREQLLREATEAVCRGPIADYKKGLISEDKLAEQIARRKDLIAAAMRDRAQPAKVVRCADCGRAATTHVHTSDYCDDHAQNHRLAEPARRMA